MTAPTRQALCEFCDEPTSWPSGARPRFYCSPTCRQRAYEERHGLPKGGVRAKRDGTHWAGCKSRDVRTDYKGDEYCGLCGVHTGRTQRKPEYESGNAQPARCDTAWLSTLAPQEHHRNITGFAYSLSQAGWRTIESKDGV